MAHTEVHPAAQPARHCHDLNAGEQQVSTAGTGTAMIKAGSAEKCPMNCCLQAAPPTAAALPAASLLLLLAATRTEHHFVPVMFASTGFSSHTDRGPPSL